MSRAIASARQRRAGITQAEPPAPPAQSKSPETAGLTLPQVIALVDSRLITLERFMKDTLDNGDKMVRFSPPQLENDGTTTIEDGEVDISSILDDFNSRFMMLAEEIASLKDTLMKLQTYTMDVNKMLLEERVNVLSDLGNENSMFVMGDATLNEVEKLSDSPLLKTTTL
jgi:hypothetical protein